VYSSKLGVKPAASSWNLFIRPGSKAPPKHNHPRQEESFKVTQGSLTIWVSGTESTLQAGEKCVVPQGALAYLAQLR
jgi:uncharacterized cupin superfamily protein